MTDAKALAAKLKLVMARKHEPVSYKQMLFDKRKIDDQSFSEHVAQVSKRIQSREMKILHDLADTLGKSAAKADEAFSQQEMELVDQLYSILSLEERLRGSPLIAESHPSP